jgi:hypothetical protein
MEALPHMRNFDIQLLGFSDVVTRALASKLGWTDQQIELRLENEIPAGKTLPGQTLEIIPYQQGDSNWVWRFEGAISDKFESELIDSESETSSDQGDSCDFDDDSRATPIEDLEQCTNPDTLEDN